MSNEEKETKRRRRKIRDMVNERDTRKKEIIYIRKYIWIVNMKKKKKIGE